MKNKDCYNVSEWQTGFPPCNGIWQILDGKYTYYARFKDGLWGSGCSLAAKKAKGTFTPSTYNNDPANNIKWRGVIDDE